jgi:hypothetical protein
VSGSEVGLGGMNMYYNDGLTIKHRVEVWEQETKVRNEFGARFLWRIRIGNSATYPDYLSIYQRVKISTLNGSVSSRRNKSLNPCSEDVLVNSPSAF